MVYYNYPSAFDYIFGAYTISVALFGLILSILLVVGMWKMFSKAGEPG